MWHHLTKKEAEREEEDLPWDVTWERESREKIKAPKYQNMFSTLNIFCLF